MDFLKILVTIFEKLLTFLSTWPGAFIFILVFLLRRKGISNILSNSIPDLFKKGVEVFSEVGIGPKGVNLKFKDTAVGKTQVTVTSIPDTNVNESYCTYTSGANRFQIGWPSKQFLCPEESKKTFEANLNEALSKFKLESNFPNPEFVLLYKPTLGLQFKESIHIIIETVPNDPSINQFLRENRENLRKYLGVNDFDFASVDERSQSALVQYNYILPPIPDLLTAIQRIVISNGLAYQVTLTQPASALSDYGKQVMYRNVLNSFVLISSGKDRN